MRITTLHTSFVAVFGALFVDIVSSQRQLSTACTFSNGTAGNKCVGNNACTFGPDIAKIGCGSCIGEQSCSGMKSVVTVGEESCIGYGACGNGKSDDRAHNVCIQIKMTRTNIYLIKVKKMSGTIPAVASQLAIGSLVSRVKLYNVCIVYRTTALSLYAKLCSCSTSSSNRDKQLVRMFMILCYWNGYDICLTITCINFIL